MSLFELGKHADKEAAERLRRGQPYGALDPLVVAGNPELDRGERPACSLGEGQDLLPGFGQHQAVWGADEQARAQRLFHGIEPAADGRMLDAEAPPGARQASRLDDGEEEAEVVPIEPVHPCTDAGRVSRIPADRRRL